VIIPAYNDSKLIVETIESILDQTYSHIEIIVVDDGSTDDTEVVLKPVRQEITYVPRVHEGWAAATNDGIQHSKGVWFLAVRPGDVLQPQAIEKQVAFLTAHPTHDVVRTTDSLVVSDSMSEKTAEHAVRSAKSTSQTPVLPMFRRQAFAGTGFFDETGDDDNGAWARWMMVTKFARCCRIGALDEPLLSLSTALGEPFKEDRYRAEIADRWVAQIEASADAVQPVHDPAIKTTTKTGRSILIIGADDLGGMFSSMASAINKYTPHNCRVLMHQATGVSDPQTLLKLPREQHGITEVDNQARQWAEGADRLVFAAGIAPGAMRRDCRLEDTDELPFGKLDWREYSIRKECLAFLCSSPSVRGNYRWYHQRFAGRGWKVITASPDIYLNVPDSRFVLPILDLSVKEYTRPEFSMDSMAVVYNQRPVYATGGEEMLVPVAHRIRQKYGRRVLFGRCVDMTLAQSLIHRQGAHIGFDRISLGAPRFGLTSLENSALGLANIVYLDPFARSLLARTLGTDELPWFSPDSPDALYDTIDRLVADPDGLQKTMIQTAEWFRRCWSAEKMIRHLIRVLED
jgi:glycosyltransferase involved in cell wall biosynthesis